MAPLGKTHGIQLKNIPRVKESNLASVLASLLAYGLILCLLGCGGEDGDVSGTAVDVKATLTTVGGIEFAHNGFYIDGELPDALRTVDTYLEMAVGCAKTVYPDLENEIDSLPVEGLLVIAMFPDVSDYERGTEAFSCNSAKSGKCAGAYNIGRSMILITPSLDALGHEITHWINDMLFGSTNHDDPDDLTNLCPISPICHLYSDVRNLTACRE